MKFEFDIIVVGAGHAGCEAACAAARLGSSTLLITLDMNKVAQMSCNPAVGGIAKGQIVREIDAMGGNMAIVTDRSSIQMRMLNRSKGPAMWSPRSQADRHRFMEYWRETLDATDNLSLWQDSVRELIVEHGRVAGVVTALGVSFKARAVILTAGTFLNGLMHVGPVQTPGGRISEPPATGLTEQLVALGLTAGRMKTGTPPRLDGRTIDFSLATEQPGDEPSHHRFSYLPGTASRLKQRSCWMVYTNAEVHNVLREALPQSPLYNGQIRSIGPRYCPSIETKIVTFAQRDSHQLFLEPEGETTAEYYLNGFSSSLPWQVQVEALRHIPALRDVQLYRPGYAIEYDYFDPTGLYHSLESKHVPGLFLAGQANGTTGYEEAAGQGLMAGINAHRTVHGMEPIVLGRDQAYIGVLIDDLVTKGVDEPYRMFTSRAEYRILLRQDDADMRLTPLARGLGSASAERWAVFEAKKTDVDDLLGFADNYTVHAAAVNGALEARGLAPLRQGCRLRDLLSRPEFSVMLAAELLPALRARIDRIPEVRRDEVVEAAEVRIKYDGYIRRERELADKILRLDEVKLRGRLNYAEIHQLSTEARQKLQAIDPDTIGQASRIPGVSPSDISVMLLLLGR